MIKRLLGTLIAVLVVLPAAQAQNERPKPQIVGLPVFAADGIKIGRVSDVSMSEGGISTASTMGFGERIVTVPQPAFTIKGDMVLIPDLSAEDVAALPGDPSKSQDARTKDRKAIIGPEPLQ